MIFDKIMFAILCQARLLLDYKIKENYNTLKKMWKRVSIHYAVKANPHKGVLNILREEGSDFDVASYHEIQALLSIGVDATKMVYANPIKASQDIVRAYNIGIDNFVFDNDAELQKLARYASGAGVLLRLYVSSESAYYKLSAKFGAPENQAIRLLKKAKKLGLNPKGIAFHVGSQNPNPDEFVNAIVKSSKIMREAKKSGLEWQMLDLGGGLPVQYNGKKVDCFKILEAVRDALDKHVPQSVEVIAEPGRFIVGDAAVLLTRVVGKSKRNGVIWYYLDDVTYGSFLYVHVSKWKFEFFTSRRGKKIRSVLAGPTCDSYDVITKN